MDAQLPLDNEEQLAALITREFKALADHLATAPSGVWDEPSLCRGWRTREVVAHVTMAARYSTDQFMEELRGCGFDFTVLSNKIAERDGQLPEATLLDNLRSPILHSWRPPGGGTPGALSHVVIHAIDITAASGCAPTVADAAMTIVLDGLADGGHTHFGIETTGRHLEAEDLD
jgi:uncharacterized protein (TIGR03083 family)